MAIQKRLNSFLNCYSGTQRDARESVEPIIPRPWMSPAATWFLDGIIEPWMNVLEIGAGGSTLWFYERVPNFHSVEGNEEWYDAVLKAGHIHNKGELPIYLQPQIEYAPPNLPEEWGDFDLVLIDGPRKTRSLCIHSIFPRMNSGGWIVLDNATPVLYHGIMDRMEKLCSVSFRIGYDWDGKYYYTQFWKLGEPERFNEESDAN